MYNSKHFTTDADAVTLSDEQSGVTVDDSGDVSIDWSSVERVTIDNVPHADAFDTKEFYRLRTTVARPIAQPYKINDEVVWLQKPRSELKKAAWSLDNSPWTHGHPDTGLVQNVDDVRGFWSDTQYYESADDLDSYLHFPVSDDESKQFIEDNPDVSVGFVNRVTQTDEYDGDVGELSTDVELDGYQTNMLFDHCASVETGRCSAAGGCGLAADSKQHGHMTADETHTTSMLSQKSQTQMQAPDFEEGDMVQWQVNPNMVGRVVHVDTERQVLMVEVMESVEGEMRPSGFTITAGYTDVIPVEDMSMVDTDINITKVIEDGDTNLTTDQSRHTHEGSWYAVPPSDNPDDEWKFPIDNCEDATDAWNLRGSGDISISVSTLEDRIKRRAGDLGCDLPDTANQNDSTTMTDDNCGCTEDGGLSIEFDDLTPEVALDKVASEHESIEQYLDGLKQKASAAETTADELDVEVDRLADKASVLSEKNETLREQVDELQRPQMEEHAEYIAEHTDRFGEDVEAVLDSHESLDDLAETRELVEELSDGTSTKTANATTDSNETNETGVKLDRRGYVDFDSIN